MEIRNNLHYVLISFVCLAYMIVSSTDFLEHTLNEFASLDLNEKGDAIAGIFSPLAFSVAMIALFLQSKELRLSREQTTKTAETLSDQTKILTQESTRKLRQDEFQYIVESANILRQMLREGAVDYIANPNTYGEVYSLMLTMGQRVFNAESDAEFFTEYRISLDEQIPKIAQLNSDGLLYKLPEKENIETLIFGLERIVRDIEQLSPIHIMKMTHYKIPLFLDSLYLLLELGLYKTTRANSEET